MATVVREAGSSPSISAAIVTAASDATLPERKSICGPPSTILASTQPLKISVGVSKSRLPTCLQAASATIPAGNQLTSDRHTGSMPDRRREPHRRSRPPIRFEPDLVPEILDPSARSVLGLWIPLLPPIGRPPRCALPISSRESPCRKTYVWLPSILYLGAGSILGYMLARDARRVVIRKLRMVRH